MADETQDAPVSTDPVTMLTTDAGGVVTSLALSNLPQPGMTAIGADVYRAVLNHGVGFCTFDGTNVSAYAPPAPPTPVPDSATRLGLMRALKEINKWAAAKDAIASSAEVQEEWDLAIEIRRTDTLTAGIVQALGLTAADVDQLLIRAAALTA